MKPTVITSGSNTQESNGRNRTDSSSSTGEHGGQRSQEQPLPHQRQFSNYQSGFPFDDDVDDMFSDVGLRSRMGRMREPLSSRFGSNLFPDISNLGGRFRDVDDDSFFTNLPPEFRQHIPEGFGFPHRNAQNIRTHQQHQLPKPNLINQQPQFYDNLANSQVPQSPNKILCDAAIQTDEPNRANYSEPDQVDSQVKVDLNQHGLRNTVDLGVKSRPEDEEREPRAHSAPPNQQPNPVNDEKMQSNLQYQSTNESQKETPRTPSGTVRTVPIFVEGRSEPIINNSSIPQAKQNQETNFKPQQTSENNNRPTPLNTQNQQPLQSQFENQPEPQTPHTTDSINKIQNIQRDVLELMLKVENFSGTKTDKEYVYLDEMLTRNLLKLDTIDTNGKDNIRQARKAAIKCIELSINALEARAMENLQKSNNLSNSVPCQDEQNKIEQNVSSNIEGNNDQVVTADIANNANETSSEDNCNTEPINTDTNTA